jgi:hypothetical protein
MSKDFSNSVVGQGMNFMTWAAGVLFPRPEMRLVPLKILEHQIDGEPLNFQRRQSRRKLNLLDHVWRA